MSNMEKSYRKWEKEHVVKLAYKQVSKEKKKAILKEGEVNGSLIPYSDKSGVFFVSKKKLALA